MIINEGEVRQFLLKHPKVRVVVASTIKNGFVSCIGPVPTICGPELMCSQNTKGDLMRVINCV